MNQTIRVVVFGTPGYAVPALRLLAEDPRVTVPLVVTQPDRPAGRGKALTPPAVKLEAERLGLPVYQPATLRDPASRQPLVDAAADLFVVAAFGLIFGEKTLSIPRIAPINLHASLLPSYRGASPITAAILNGDAETGVSLMVMERGLDSGPVIATRAIPIPADATTESLTPALGEVGAALLIDTLGGFVAGEVVPVLQPDAGISLVRPLTKADGEIDWRQPAEQIERHVRAMWSWPRAWTRLGDETLQIHATSLDTAENLAPGELDLQRGRVVVGTGDRAIVLEQAQFPGKAAMDRAALANSGRLRTGERFALDLPSRPPIVTTLASGSATTA
jgi:methionyl-tRNA formyltransferase